MTDYDDLFAETAPEDSVFADKGALDPLAEPEEVLARESQQRELATILNGLQEGYLPPTVSVYGPPGTGKTLTTRRTCTAFAAREAAVAVEYVNLKECRTLFAAANEIHLELTGERKGAYEGLDGVFEGIWTALAAYPDWTILLLDEIDHIQHDMNYDPNDFFYRLLRGEGKLTRGVQLSVWLISNELLAVDLRLDSRVESAMSDEEVFFPPYGVEELRTILEPRLDRAFQEGVLSESVLEYGVSKAATRWGDVRKALRLFRRAGETANERGLDAVTGACLDANMAATERESTEEKLLALPAQHFFVLYAATRLTDRRTGEIHQPVTSGQLWDSYTTIMSDDVRVSRRAVRDVVTDLETMGLVDTWVDARGQAGRTKYIETTFEPGLVGELLESYADADDMVEVSTLTDTG